MEQAACLGLVFMPRQHHADFLYLHLKQHQPHGLTLTYFSRVYDHTLPFA